MICVIIYSLLIFTIYSLTFRLDLLFFDGTVITG